MDTIKFLDLKACYPIVREEIFERINNLVDNSRFSEGVYVREFEKAFADYCGVKHCIAVNNGTSALVLSLMVSGVGVGDEVVVPVNTFIATAEAVSLVGAKPVFVDVDKDTQLIDVGKIKTVLTEKTKVIIPVHIFGQCADMRAVMAVAKANNLIVIEDACQAHGATYMGKKAGSMGELAAFSFYPGKNLGGWGESGAVTTNNDHFAETLRQLKSHGEIKKYQHNLIGGNFRMNEMQAAVLGVKLKYLDYWNGMRGKRADLYFDLLVNSDIVLPRVGAGNLPVWHLFTVQINNRDLIKKRLLQRGIETGIHYPSPLHLTKAYEQLGYKKGDFPVAESVQQKILSLPMYPELSRGGVSRVAEALLQLVGNIK